MGYTLFEGDVLHCTYTNKYGLILINCMYLL